MKIYIKPLSVNEAWQGRRYKTNKYKTFEEELLYKLPNDIEIEDKKPIGLHILVGVSTILFDLDNALKPFLDVLQKKYDFNDRYITQLKVWKDIVDKGEEYLEFEIYNINT
jgi:Holliday junction resolvase RusA-like endonuclease